MEIILATEQHIPVIRDIAYDTWPHTFGDILSKEQIAYMLEWMYSADSLKKQMNELGHQFFIATEGDRFYGYISYEVNYNQRPKTKIHKIYILPQSQGLGVGKKLMDKVIETATAHQDTHLTLNVNRHNKALDFYKKIGFEVSGKEDIDIGDGFIMADYVMTKTI
jgi:ribosomal protein S18 acetylase RimI-like enzyme